MDVQQLFRDRKCAVTPNGRPRNTPKKLVEHFSHYSSLKTNRKNHQIGYSECISSRPPLPMELLTTPSPCTYTIPCNNSNTATRVYRNNYFNKIDNIMTPTPCTYTVPYTIGRRLPDKKNCPSFTIGKQERLLLARKGTDMDSCHYSYEVTKRQPIKTRPSIINRVHHFYVEPNFLLMGINYASKKSNFNTI